MSSAEVQDGTISAKSAVEDHLSKSLFKNKSLVSVKDLGRPELNQILAVASYMRTQTEQQKSLNILKGAVLGLVFFEPSTRTSTSFDAAMKRLGGQTAILNESYSSTQKGETIADTIITLSQYTDGIVMRHPLPDPIYTAASVATVPVINAGNGSKEHPTQALLDLFTIVEELGTDSLDKPMVITFVGDLRYGRTVHSLCQLLKLYPSVKINFCSPPSLDMPSEWIRMIQESGQLGVVANELSLNVVAESDVIYCTRVQKERFEDLSLYDRVKDSFIVNAETMKNAKQKMIVMHPLPRNAEIAIEVDSDPRAAYFRQMKYGMFLRMALLALTLKHYD